MGNMGAVGAGAGPGDATELTGEIIRISDANLLGDLADAQVRSRQQPAIRICNQPW